MSPHKSLLTSFLIGRIPVKMPEPKREQLWGLRLTQMGSMPGVSSLSAALAKREGKGFLFLKITVFPESFNLSLLMLLHAGIRYLRNSFEDSFQLSFLCDV